MSSNVIRATIAPVLLRLDLGTKRLRSTTETSARQSSEKTGQNSLTLTTVSEKPETAAAIEEIRQ